jgi:hypothetical protein
VSDDFGKGVGKGKGKGKGVGDEGVGDEGVGDEGVGDKGVSNNFDKGVSGKGDVLLFELWLIKNIKLDEMLSDIIIIIIKIITFIIFIYINKIKNVN